jgi:Glyoxalase-like domain
MLSIDHVVQGVEDLDAAGQRLEETFGLASIAGGRHTAWGTGNRIVPLGESYVELLGVVDEDVAEASPVGRAVRELVAGGDRWLCWCVATDDLDGTAARLRVDVDEWSRLRPDGTTLRWRSAGFPFVLSNPVLPFFITWEVPPDLHPGAAAADHRVTPTGISWVEVGEDPRLTQWLGEAELPVKLSESGRGLVAVGVATSQGEIELR